ncbi:metallophosphoesterase [Mangrovibacterium lignilyticum]|uniref:metallophosphoesterase n=1 Tax=Mangrovibacterium lignilyticum TaxID=2668052 RepID=UPI0013D719FB|nr:metallophosphoesterase [Mangrovibacterium lignilyticum]
MRGIPGSGVIVFFLVIILIEVLAYLGILQLISGKRQRKLGSIIYGFTTMSFLVIWMIAFFNPEKIRQTTDYTFFYFVIALSVMNLFPKALMALATIISFPFRMLRDQFLSKLILLSGVLISLGIILSVAYGITFGKETLQTNKVDLYLDSLPPQLNQLKIVQISDFHLGSFKSDQFLQTTTAEINRLKPDLIVFTGDMVNNYYQEMIGFENALKEMKAPYGKFAIFGNHDYGDYSNWDEPEDKAINHAKVSQKIRDAGFKLLQNRNEKVEMNDTSLYIVGVENWGHKPFPQYAELDSAMQNVPAPAFKILLTHDPAHWEAEVLPKTNIALTLSGHTHGGQFGLKIAGITFSPMYLAQKFWAGLYLNNNQYLYVNQGWGCVGFPGRIDMNPEITLLTLHSNRIETN